MEKMKNEILMELKKKKLTLNQLCKSMHIKGEGEVTSFINILNELEKDGQIYLDSNGYYQEFNTYNLKKVQGIINISKSGNGVMFVSENGQTRKFSIAKKDLAGAMDKDIVVLKDLKKGNSTYIFAKVEKIIHRTTGKAVFEYKDDNTLVSYNMQNNVVVVCPKEQLKQIVTGNRVLVNIGKDLVAKFDDKLVFDGTVDRIIGHKDDPTIDIKTIAANHGFFTDFPPQVEEELKNIPNTVSEKELEGRIDLRNEVIFTIDGKDTKDMDDAISIKKDEDGNYILGVHIADVSHYVKKGSALYEEAKMRGTSAYLATSVLPMLPHQLSNGICSLNEGVDRLTKSVVMKYNKNGKLLDYEINDTVINSNKKMNYQDVNKLLENNEVVLGYENFKDDLLLMKELSEILSSNREKRGNINFGSNEIKTKTDETGKPISFVKCNQKTAETIIENFMIAANETVTRHYSYMNVPFVYRVHGNPSEEKLIKALKMLKDENICDPMAIDRLINKITNSKCTSKDLSEFLEGFKGEEQHAIISGIILRSMSKAEYSPVNEGHYGLALQYYTHFTSPIRRFPDLTVHHLIEEYKTFENLEAIEHRLPGICEHSSFMEREADKAEKETLELKMAEYMKEHVGMPFVGTITQITPYGMSIRLENNVKAIANKEDIVKRIPNKKGNGSHRATFKLGDTVYALVKEVSIPHRAIYLSISDEPIKKKKKKTKQKKLTK